MSDVAFVETDRWVTIRGCSSRAAYPSVGCELHSFPNGATATICVCDAELCNGE